MSAGVNTGEMGPLGNPESASDRPEYQSDTDNVRPALSVAEFPSSVRHALSRRMTYDDKGGGMTTVERVVTLGRLSILILSVIAS